VVQLAEGPSCSCRSAPGVPGLKDVLTRRETGPVPPLNGQQRLPMGIGISLSETTFQMTLLRVDGVKVPENQQYVSTLSRAMCRDHRFLEW